MLSNLAVPGHLYGVPLLQSSKTNRGGLLAGSLVLSGLERSNATNVDNKEHTNEAHTYKQAYVTHLVLAYVA